MQVKCNGLSRLKDNQGKHALSTFECLRGLIKAMAALAENNTDVSDCLSCQSTLALVKAAIVPVPVVLMHMALTKGHYLEFFVTNYCHVGMHGLLVECITYIHAVNPA